MKLKLISLFLLALFLQSSAMEQNNKDWMKKEEIKNIDRNESLGNLSILPDEILIKIILSGIENANYEDAKSFLEKLKKINKKVRCLANDDVVKNEFKQLKREKPTEELSEEKELGLFNCDFMTQQLLTEEINTIATQNRHITATMQYQFITKLEEIKKIKDAKKKQKNNCVIS